MKDLYYEVNGEWIAQHTIPSDRGVDGTFHKLRDDAEAQVRDIVTQGSGRAATLYESFMDTDALSMSGLAEDFELIRVPGIDALTTALGKLDRLGVTAPVSFYVAKDSAGEDAVAYLVQAGLGLPDEAYYYDPAHQETLAAYRAHVERMLAFLTPEHLTFGGTTFTPAEATERILALETEIADAHWDKVACRQATKTFNPTELAALPEPVAAILRGARLPEGRVIACMPSYFDRLGELLCSDRLIDWQLLTAWHILRSRAGLLPEEVGRANFDFYGTRLTGATEQRDRWKRAVGLAEAFVGEEIGQEFVRRHFPASSKEDMLRLVDYLLAAYRERISSLSWMTPATREKALAKLAKFQAKIGYPDHWRSYEGLEFSASGAELVANYRAGTAFSHDYEVAKLGKPADRSEWVTTPQTVNAFYNPVVNDITFPAAILQPPFYSPDADAAANFGAIGAVIGHEIGHGFDDQGSQYDGDGNLNSWWTDEDRSAFEALTAKLVDQFDGRVPTVLAEARASEGDQEATSGVNGAFTLGENIGDLGGLCIAVVAYRKWVADQGSEVTREGLQRFFLSFARIWRTAIRPEAAAQYLAIDPHSPAEFRCNITAANVPELYEAFDVEPDAPMYIAPQDRVTIW